MNKKPIKKTVILSAVALVLVLLSYFALPKILPPKTSPTATSMTVVKFAWSSAFPSPVMIAEEKGYLAEEGIELERVEIPNMNLTTEAIGRGEIDVAIINLSTLFAFQSASPGKFEIFYEVIETPEYPNSFFIVRDNINSVDDLRGKKIAIRAGVQSEVESKAIFQGMGSRFAHFHGGFAELIARAE